MHVHFSVLAQDDNAPNEPNNRKVTPIHDGSGSTLLSWNGTTPESPTRHGKVECRLNHRAVRDNTVLGDDDDSVSDNVDIEIVQ